MALWHGCFEVPPVGLAFHMSAAPHLTQLLANVAGRAAEDGTNPSSSFQTDPALAWGAF